MHDRLPMQMEEARKVDKTPSPFRLLEAATQVYVSGSVAGGTGSGTFLDTGILLRHLVPDAIIQGFFLMNWVYRNKVFAPRIRGNAYAALAELDYLQGVDAGASRGPYTVTYGDETVTVSMPPYSLFHLIDGKKENGQTVDDVDQLCETVAKAIFLSTSSMGEAVSSVADNLFTLVHAGSTRLWNGRSARYSSYGLSSLYYPARELHRACASWNASGLCQRALAEIQDGPNQDARAAVNAARVDTEVSAFFTRLDLTRESVREAVCPYHGEPDIEVTRADVAHPEGLKDTLAQEEARQDRALEESAGTKAFLDQTVPALDRKLVELDGDATLDSAFRRQWRQAAVTRLDAWSQEVAAEIATVTQDIEQLRATCAAQLGEAPRASTCRASADRASRPLRNGGVRHRPASRPPEPQRATKERECCDAILAHSKLKMPSSVATDRDVVAALQASARRLAALAATDRASLLLLRKQRDQVLVGNGNIIITDKGKTVLLEQQGKIAEEFDAFRSEKGIHNPEDYLGYDRNGPDDLDTLFLGFCQEKLAHLLDVDVMKALETLGTDRGDCDAFIEEQFDHLFRLASPLWSYDHARLTEVRQLLCEKAVTIGVAEKDEGRTALDRYVNAVKGRNLVANDHAYSTTRDRQRVWLLSFSAPLPMYFIGELSKIKERYEEEIAPSYHMDRRLEMDVPDLLPGGDMDSQALRLLGMAIVPGIDVVVDFKKPKGHKFTFDRPDVRRANFGEPKVWELFRTMYDEVRADVKEDGEASLLDMLRDALKARVAELSNDAVRAAISAHVEKLKRKMAARDFSRVVSARLTYREIAELEQFLETRARRGYGMDLESYLGGH